MRNGSLPAQPCSIEPNAQGAYFGEKTVHCTGLTKRELFAAMAMQGLISNMSLVHGAHALAAEQGTNTLQFIASSCVDYADSLLVELERTA